MRVSYSKDLRAMDKAKRCGMFTLDIVAQNQKYRQTFQGPLTPELQKALEAVFLKLCRKETPVLREDTQEKGE